AMRTTSSLLLLLVGVVVSLADDRSFCAGECAKKYKEENTKSSCAAGCAHRGTISDGSRGFLVCHSACAAAHNETDTEERRACDYACSLPVTNIVMMKVDYGTGDEAPRVQVVRKEGGDILGSDIGMGPDFDQFILRAADANGGALAGKGKGEAAKTLKGDDFFPPDQMLQSMFRMKTGDKEFDNMQERLDKIVKSFFDRSHMASRVASERPSGHDDLGSLMGSSVDNEDEDGRQILFVTPLEGEEMADLKDFERSHQSSIRRRFPVFFQWSVCLVLLIAIFCTMVVAMLMIRQMRVNRYRAIRNHIRMEQAIREGNAAPLPLVEAGEMIKKLPLDEEDPYPAPEGVPPPAYDQLSVHSKKGDNQQ
ncbi:hypothetical protein PFISCL1PPCAC_7880, partial [Pristionchus fissidentatus]